MYFLASTRKTPELLLLFLLPNDRIAARYNNKPRTSCYTYEEIFGPFISYSDFSFFANDEISLIRRTTHAFLILPFTFYVQNLPYRVNKIEQMEYAYLYEMEIGKWKFIIHPYRQKYKYP